MNTLCNIPEGCLSIKHRQQQGKDFKKNCRKINNTAGKTSQSTACLFQLWLNFFPGLSVNLGICVGLWAKMKARGLGGVHIFFMARNCEPPVSLLVRISASSVLSRPGGVIRPPPSRASSANHTSHGSANRKINCRPAERLTGGRFL